MELDDNGDVICKLRLSPWPVQTPAPENPTPSVLLRAERSYATAIFLVMSHTAGCLKRRELGRAWIVLAAKPKCPRPKHRPTPAQASAGSHRQFSPSSGFPVRDSCRTGALVDTSCWLVLVVVVVVAGAGVGV